MKDKPKVRWEWKKAAQRPTNPRRYERDRMVRMLSDLLQVEEQSLQELWDIVSHNHIGAAR